MFIWFHRKDSCLYLKSMGIALEIKRNMWLTKLNLRHRMWSFNFIFFCLSQCDRIQTKIAEYHRCSFTPVTDIADPNDVLIQTQQLLLLFYCCQNFVSYVTINGEMWADVALTVCFLHWAAWQARVTSAFLECLILSLFHPVWHSSVGCWGHCGWAGALQNSCSSELCSQSPPSACPWNLRYLTGFLEITGETHFSSHRWPLQALIEFIPDFSPCLLWYQASLTAAPLWFQSQLCSHKARGKTGCQNQVDGSLQPLGFLEFQRKGISGQVEVF